MTNPASAANGLQAVLFDMDGLLVDTEPLWFETEAEVMGRLGGPWTHEDQKLLLGGSMEKTVQFLLARATVPASPADVERWMSQGVLDRVNAGRVTVMPGARELLAEVAAAGVPHALVTSSQRPFVDAVLAAARLSFDVMVTGDDVPVTKPDPAPYLLGAKLLGAEPARCVAMEDSPNGVASATAAGCKLVAVPSFTNVPAADGRLVVQSLADISLDTLRTLATAA